MFREIAARGLEAIEDRPAVSRERLQEFHDLFLFVETEVPAILGRFLIERAGRPAGRIRPMTAVIQTERLTKSYGVHRGITELDLEVEPGEIFGFLGPNGAGKTTTMRVLLDLIRPDLGARRRSSASRRRSIRSPSTDESATCPASSTCTTA